MSTSILDPAGFGELLLSVGYLPLDAARFGFSGNPKCGIVPNSEIRSVGFSLKDQRGGIEPRRKSMVVTSKCIGHRVTGLYVGSSNVRRYFSKRATQIELKLDHLLIECGLSPDFWRDDPEIYDPRLCLWLESKQRNHNGHAQFAMALIPSGKNSFILDPASPANNEAAEPIFDEVGDAHEYMQSLD
jgi:hypothetical protein